MTKRNKRFLVAGVVIVLALLAVSVALRYFPFTKLIRLQADSESAFSVQEDLNRAAPHTLYFDFEVAPGKDVPGGVEEGLAHSGKYAVKVFGKNSYGVAIERTAGQVGVENLRAIGLSAWVYVKPTTNDIKGALVFTASNELGVNVCWKGVHLGGAEIPQGTWFKISGYYDLTGIEFKPDYKLQIYFWNDSRTDILVDDYFVVFGAPVDRRGDSAHVDLTRGIPYSQEFNRPPYPVGYLRADGAPLTGSPAGTGEKTVLPVIHPTDIMVAGRFADTRESGDQVLLLKAGSKADLLVPCDERKAYKRISMTVPPDAGPYLHNAAVARARFLPGSTDQLLITSEKGSLLCAMALSGDPCSDGTTASLKVLRKSTAKEDRLLRSPGTSLVSGDFNCDGITEILAITAGGTWKMMKYDAAGGWKVLAGEGKPAVGAWITSDAEAGFSAGRFVTAINRDGVLAVVRNRETGKITYSLMHFQPGTGGFEPWFTANQDHLGETIGPDTLKPGDRFFTGNFGSGPAVFRYNRDWRFDLKEIRFSDSTFQVLRNIDFSGYPADHNPKYYESLQLVPGRQSTGPVFFVAGANKSGSALPAFIQRYTFTPNPDK
jgi:hypothetical protein